MPGSERWIMPYELAMTACQVRDPVEAFILMETHDFTRRSRRLCFPGFHNYLRSFYAHLAPWVPLIEASAASNPIVFALPHPTSPPPETHTSSHSP
jgi:hypothetical protein